MRTPAAVASLAALLAACGDPATTDSAPGPGDNADPSAAVAPDPTPPGPPPVPPARDGQGGAADWREIASSDDASRLGRLDQAWRMGRAEADQHFAARVEALGPLVDPNAGQAGRLQPPPGQYRCRSIKLGSNGPGGPGYLEYPFFRCTVELTPRGDLVLTKTTGSQRTRGLLYPDTDRRLVFLGAQAWGSEETGWPAYGQTPGRDQIGVLERLGSDRWRLVLPWPKYDSKLEILELVR